MMGTLVVKILTWICFLGVLIKAICDLWIYTIEWVKHIVKQSQAVHLKFQTCFSLHVISISRTSFTVNLLCSCLNAKESLARNRCDIWSLSEINGIRTHNYVVRKQTLNQIAKLGQLCSCFHEENTNYFQRSLLNFGKYLEI